MARVENLLPARTWIFQARSDVYPLDEKLKPGVVENWRLLRFQKVIRVGEVVHFWQAGPEAAILGWGIVEGEPVPDPDDPDRHRIRVRYESRLDSPLPKSALQADRWLRSLSIIRAPEGTNFAVTTEQAIALNRMLRNAGLDAPPDPGPFLPLEVLLDGDLSATTRRVVEEGSGLAGNGSVPALSSSMLLFAFVRIGLTSEREFLDTSRFLAREAGQVDQAREGYLRQGWRSDPELVMEEKKGASFPEPTATRACAVVLSAATRLALATTGSRRVSLRHLLGALIEVEPLVTELGAQQRFEEAGTRLPRIRRRFVEYLRRQHPRDSFGHWEEILLAPGEQISLLANYDRDLPTTEDKLGIKAEVDALASLIASQVVVPPLSIGLFGDWGSGKSSFMQMMQDRVSWICNRSDSTAPDGSSFYRNIVQIKFNAWHYSEANIWASLVAHIFENLQLSLAGEKKDDVEERRALILAELEGLETRREEVRAALELEEKALDEKKAALLAAETEAEERSQELNQVRQQDVLDALSLNPRIRALVQGAAETLGLEQVAEGADAKEVYALVQQVHSIGSQSQALWLSILNSENWRRRLLWLGAVLVAFVILTAGLTWFLSIVPSQTLEAVKTQLSGLVSVLAVGAGWLSKHASNAQRALGMLQEADADFNAQIDDERFRIREELTATRKELEDQLARVGAVRREVEQVEQSVAEKRAQLRDLEPDRLFARFIEERALCEDYRKELGILSLVHKDFKRLASFLGTPDALKRSHLLAIDRIILYIDDLDRCPEDKVIQVLQAVHLMLNLPLFIVVVAVDTRWIRRALPEKYGSLIQDARPSVTGSMEHLTSGAATSEDYLEKIFQVPFWIKPMAETGARALVRSLIEKDLEPATDDSGAIGQPSGAGGPAVLGAPDEGSEAPAGGESGDAGESSRGTVPDAPPDPDWILEPQRLLLKQSESKVIDQLAPLIGRSPRAAKRFVNVYRVLRAGLRREELARFLGEDEDTGTPRYPAALLLLSVLNGSPSLATHLFQRLAAGQAEASLGDFMESLSQDAQIANSSEWERFFEFLGPFLNDWGDELPVGLLQEWAPHVARYSFRMEMAVRP